jgi:hypothetical protein
MYLSGIHSTLSFSTHFVIPDLIGNPESSKGPKEEWIPFFKGMTQHFVIPEYIYRESTAFTKEWIPVYTGMTEKGTGMTVKLSSPCPSSF